MFTVRVEYALVLDFQATLSIFHSLDTHKRKGERDNNNKTGERETRTDKHKEEERRKDVVVEDTFLIFKRKVDFS